MNGLIELEEMSFYAFHGCFKEEQVVGNQFTVTISFTTNSAVAAISDHLADTVNYVQIYNITKREMTLKSHLLEHVTARIINSIKADFPQIETLKVKVSKLNPPVGGQMKQVSFTMTA